VTGVSTRHLKLSDHLALVVDLDETQPGRTA
jgi:hypothetical protein